MENIDHEISKLEIPMLDVYDTSIEGNLANTNLVSQDEYGFSKVLPLYLDKQKDIVLDRIIGLKPDQQLNEYEKDISNKRKLIEKEYMMDLMMD